LCVLLAGLFHRGISQSGTALCTWALAANGSSSYQAKKLASLLGCPTSPTADLVDCLRTMDARDIIATDKQFMVYMHGPQQGGSHQASTLPQDMLKKSKLEMKLIYQILILKIKLFKKELFLWINNLWLSVRMVLNSLNVNMKANFLTTLSWNTCCSPLPQKIFW
jgi:carboxylesterase type B